MLEIDMGLVSNALVGILTGVLAGIHSGVIVARMAKFEEIKNQAKKIILSIDYNYSSDLTPEITTRKDVSELLHLSSDFYALKHKIAGKKLSSLDKEINIVLYSPPKQFEEMNEIYLEWQKSCRELKPNLRVIFSLRPWV